jgi:catalase (peroxidase I)
MGPGWEPLDRIALRSSCGFSCHCECDSDSQKAFVRDFVAAWNKVMNLDRFDLA